MSGPHRRVGWRAQRLCACHSRHRIPFAVGHIPRAMDGRVAFTSVIRLWPQIRHTRSVEPARLPDSAFFTRAYINAPNALQLALRPDWKGWVQIRISPAS
jgi:hypothetical protein